MYTAVGNTVSDHHCFLRVLCCDDTIARTCDLILFKPSAPSQALVQKKRRNPSRTVFTKPFKIS